MKANSDEYIVNIPEMRQYFTNLTGKVGSNFKRNDFYFERSSSELNVVKQHKATEPSSV